MVKKYVYGRPFETYAVVNAENVSDAAESEKREFFREADMKKALEPYGGITWDEQGIQTSVSIKQTEPFTNTGLTGIRGMKMKKQEWNSILMMCLSIHQKNIFQPMPADYGLDYGFRTAGLERQILKLLILKSIL